MASEVTICNLALSHLGDTAEVMSIKPPDSSVQAQLCARFYFAARNALLEMAAWGFATRRVKLALLEKPTEITTWLYCYALPDAVINALAVLPCGAMDDYEARLPEPCSIAGRPYFPGSVSLPEAMDIMPQPYALETLASGAQIVLTNVPDAVFRYTTLVEDTTKFSPLFVMALSYLLASMLAGPLIKGDAGTKANGDMLVKFRFFEAQAEESDANQRKTNLTPAVPWMMGR